MYVVESLRVLRSKCKVWYVGGLALEVPKQDQDKVTNQLAVQFECIPVFIPAETARQFEDFCHDTLKPIFHFVHPTSKEVIDPVAPPALRPKSPHAEADRRRKAVCCWSAFACLPCSRVLWHGSDAAGASGLGRLNRVFLKQVCKSFNNAVEGGVKPKTEGSKWQLYNSVNLAYTQPVAQHFNDGDSVFVFDLELLMCPTLIGSRARTANICFVFNTPFPSAEIFRTIPVRKQILM